MEMKLNSTRKRALLRILSVVLFGGVSWQVTAAEFIQSQVSSTESKNAGTHQPTVVETTTVVYDPASTEDEKVARRAIRRVLLKNVQREPQKLLEINTVVGRGNSF